jgi:hypothetical protein
MSQSPADRPIATAWRFGMRRHRPVRAVLAGLVLASTVAVLAGPSLAAGLRVSAQLPRQGFPITPREPPGSWRLTRAVTVTANCVPSGSAPSCLAKLTLVVAQLGPARGLPPVPKAQLSQIMMTFRPTEQQTVKVRFVLSHKVLDLLYAYPDPRCYVIATITSGKTSRQAQLQFVSMSQTVNIR